MIAKYLLADRAANRLQLLLCDFIITRDDIVAQEPRK